MKLKIMTFNIRYDNPLDGINAFAGRRDMILEFLRRERLAVWQMMKESGHAAGISIGG